MREVEPREPPRVERVCALLTSEKSTGNFIAWYSTRVHAPQWVMGLELVFEAMFLRHHQRALRYVYRAGLQRREALGSLATAYRFGGVEAVAALVDAVASRSPA